MRYTCPGCLRAHEAGQASGVVSCPSCGRYVDLSAGTAPAPAPRLKPWLLLGCTALFVIAAATTIGVLAYRKTVRPDAARQGQEWTHKELLAHLEAKGLKHEVVQRSEASIWGGPYVRLRFHDRQDVTISLEKTAAEAKDKAGALGKSGFAWGRFIVKDGDDRAKDGEANEWLPLIKAALDGKDVSAEAAAVGQSFNAGFDLGLINGAYEEYEKANGRPPARAADLANWSRTNAPPAISAIEQTRAGGKYVVRWGAGRVGGGDATVLAYESKCPASGGVVLMANGEVKTVTAAEFARLPKP